MLTISEAKKIPYSQVDSETEAYLYDMFRRYVVRKQIADNNNMLKSVFAKKLRTSNPRDFSNCYNHFNSAFVNANLIGQLSYDEASTDFLRSLSEDEFNRHLNSPHNSFERKIALICYSGRASERIANRAEFSVMVAYANMQQKVMEYVKKFPQKSLTQIISIAAEEVRTEHKTTTGIKINDTSVAEKRTDYKSLAKKAAPVWQSMLASFLVDLDAGGSLDVESFMRQYFIFTKADKQPFDEMCEEAKSRADVSLKKEQGSATARKIRFNSYYDVSDYDEVFSPGYATEVYNDELKIEAKKIFNKYIEDLNFTPKEKGKQ